MKEQIEKIIAQNMPSNSDAAIKIADHVFQFIEWCIINCYKIYDGNWYGVCDEDKTYETIEDLYKFWYDNVFSKTKKG